MKRIFILSTLAVMLLTGCGNDLRLASSPEQNNKIAAKSDRSFINSSSDNRISSSESSQTESVHSLSSSEAAYYLAQTRSQNQDILSTANSKSYTQPMQTIAFKKMYENYLYYGILPERSNTPSLRSMNDADKIQCLRKINDSRYYCIYKTDNGGLFYCFFNNCALYNAVFSLKALRFSNFNSIKVGSSLEAVDAIDPIVSEILKASSSQNALMKFTKHLLKDGLLIISYRQENGKYVVSKKEFYPDFKITDTIENRQFTYDYSILPQDYIH